MAAQRRGIPVSGFDINPVAGLFCNTKLHGFDAAKATALALTWAEQAKKTKHAAPVRWESKNYWFTPKTLDKFERLRFAAKTLNLTSSSEGQAVLLSYALSIRLCSRADQRSPKPFVSVAARLTRAGLHFDPYRCMASVLSELIPLHSKRSSHDSWFRLADVAHGADAGNDDTTFSHVLTSPPYINAQDYFRNFKLELYLLEGILPFKVDDLRQRFIGTERGALLENIGPNEINAHLRMVPHLRALQRSTPRLAAVVHRYVHDMGATFEALRARLESGGICVVVCGDNLIGGFRIPTWRILERLLAARGFVLFDRFRDSIQDRLLAPKRCGHKGLIKQEVVSAFRLQ